jgi:transposase
VLDGTVIGRCMERHRHSEFIRFFNAILVYRTKNSYINLTTDCIGGWGMRTGRPVAKIELSNEVARILEGYAQRRKTAQALALRARIVLGCAAGLSNKAVAAHERVTVQTAGKWRRRFVERGLDGLLDEPRPGAPRTIDDAKVENVIVQTLESRPAGATHWSTRSMARHSGISTSSVGRIWRAFGLQPHRIETFQFTLVLGCPDYIVNSISAPVRVRASTVNLY